MNSTLPHPNNLQELLTFAEHITDQTRSLILGLWLDADIGTKLKEDKTPVTEVDLKAETLARKLIHERYPDHGVIGEEYEPSNPESDYQWTIDPIDGTQNLVNRIPTFGTLIGLRYKNQAIIGVIDHPALNLRCTGGLGIGVNFNGNQIKLENLPSENLSDSDILVTNNIGVFCLGSEEKELFHKVISMHPHTRIYYDCYSHTLAVTGSIAVVVEPNLKIWDLTPVEVLIREAGGSFEYFNIQEDNGAATLYNAVFGKTHAVRFALAQIEKSKI